MIYRSRLKAGKKTLAMLKGAGLMLSTLFFWPHAVRAGLNEWTTSGPGGICTFALAVSPNFAVDRTIFAGTDSNYGTGGQGVYRSNDGGQSWWQINSGITNLNIHQLAVSPNFTTDGTIFAGTWNGGIFRSTNGGDSWTQVNTGLSYHLSIGSIAFSPGYASDHTVLVGTETGLIFKSVNGGTTWAQIVSGHNEIRGLTFSPNYAGDQTIFASGYGDGVFMSTNGGTTWFSSSNGITDTFVSDLVISPNYAVDKTVFAGGNTIYKSSDGGQNWTEAATGFTAYYVGSMVISPNYAVDQTVFVSAHGVFRTQDGGQTWREMKKGLNEAWAPSIDLAPNFTNDPTLFTGTETGVYRYTIDDSLLPPPLVWESRASMPSPRIMAAAVPVNTTTGQKIFVLGGTAQLGPGVTQPLSTVEAYDPKTNSWQTRPSLCTPKAASAALQGNTIYLAGGIDYMGVSSSVVAYDTITGASYIHGYLNTGRFRAGTAIIGDLLYVVGGTTVVGPPGNGQVLNTIEVYSLSARRTVDTITLPMPMDTAAVATVGGKIYVMGGYYFNTSTQNFSVVNNVLECDPVMHYCLDKMPMPEAAEGQAAVGPDGKIFVVSSWWMSVQQYDPVANTWTILDNVPTSRSFPSVAIASGYLHVIGGINSSPTGTNEAARIFTPTPMVASYYFPSIRDNDSIGWENYLTVQAKELVPMEVTLRVYDLNGVLQGTYIYSNTDPGANGPALAPNARVALRPSWIAGSQAAPVAIEGSVIVETSVPAIASTNSIANYYKGFSIYEAAKPRQVHNFPKAFDGPDNYQVYMLVQNIHPTATNVTVKLFGKTPAEPGHGVSKTYAIPAHGTLKVRPSEVAPHDPVTGRAINFSGSVVVYSDLTNSGDGLGPAIPAMCRYEAGTEALAIYESTVEQPSLNFPVIKDGRFGGALDFQNFVSVVNPSTTTIAAISIILYNNAGIEEGRITDALLPPGGKNTWRPSWIKGSAAMPKDFEGSIVVTTNIPVVGQTNTIYPGNNQYGADGFDLFESAIPASSLLFPKVYDNLLGSGTGATHLTDNFVYIQNSDGTSRNITIDLYNSNGTLNRTAQVGIAPYASYVFRPKDLVTDGTNVFRGSVRITEAAGLSVAGAIKYEVHKTTNASSGIEAMTIYRSMGQ